MGPVEAAPEYRVIVDANNLTVEIENELSECREGEQRRPCLLALTPSSRPQRGGGQDPTGLPRGPAPKLLTLVQVQG